MGQLSNYHDRNRRRQARAYRRCFCVWYLAVLPLGSAAVPLAVLELPMSAALAAPMAVVGLIVLLMREG